jgi:hypothetical protein
MTASDHRTISKSLAGWGPYMTDATSRASGEVRNSRGLPKGGDCPVTSFQLPNYNLSIGRLGAKDHDHSENFALLFTKSSNFDRIGRSLAER